MDSHTDINGNHPTRGAQMARIQAFPVSARGDKMSDVQSGGMLKPKRQATRIPTDKLGRSSAFKVRAKEPKFKAHKVVVK